MKKIRIALGLGLIASGSAFAQSSVTLYGIADVSVRFTKNAFPNDSSLTEMTNGAITNSRLGFRGAEDLGGGNKALFRLEGGFDPDTGAGNGAGGGFNFNRYSWVGLSGGWGTVKAGRQDTEAFNLFANYLDPLTVGNYTANSWPYFGTQVRLSNAVSYTNNFDGLDVGATWGFGEQPGGLKKNSYFGGHTSYIQKQWTVGGVYQEFRNTTGDSQRMWGLGGKYFLTEALGLYAGYLGGRDSTGVLDKNWLNAPTRSDANSTTPITYGDYSENPRKDTTFYTGATYQATAPLALTAAFYYDRAKNKNGLSNNKGKRYAGVFLAEYSLSKRTQIYGTVDYNKVKDASYTELPGRKTNQTGVAAGMRHIF